jgi:hypothetical protein
VPLTGLRDGRRAAPPGCLAHFVGRHLERRPNVVESARERQDARDRHPSVRDRRWPDPGGQEAIVPIATGDQPLERRTIGRGNDADHRTILFSGYSTMPCAPAAFNFGIRSRTVVLR